MKITLASLDSLKEADLVVVPANEVDKNFGNMVQLVDKLNPGILKLARADHYEPKEGHVYKLRTDGKFKKIVLVGLPKTCSRQSLRKYVAQATNLARTEKGKKLSVILPAKLNIKSKVLGEALAEGAFLADYRFLTYKDEERKARGASPLEEVVFFSNLDQRQAIQVKEGLKRGRIYSEATILARELVNEPASTMTPTDLVNHAKALAKQNHDSVRLQIFDQTQLKKMGAGGILAVAKGSHEPAFMIHLTYKSKSARGGSAGKKKIVVVGKGITFDSGGLSLKSSSNMEDMKIDMAGCAAMLGVISACAQLKLKVEVHGISAVCENMPSGQAAKPGDIVRTMSGKTIEILNTDAEGRVTLADTLYFATTLEPNVIIDLATLTGACMVGLGDEVAGLMTNNDKLAKDLLAAAAQAGEMLWPLPMPDSYVELVKSKYADLKNIGGKYGGAIAAGLFLREFVGDKVWAHLDIAGPAWAERETSPLQPLGGTGYGVRTLLKYLESL